MRRAVVALSFLLCIALAAAVTAQTVLLPTGLATSGWTYQASARSYWSPIDNIVEAGGDWSGRFAPRCDEQASGPAPRPASDFDGDLKSEVLWHHVTRGEVWLWAVDGTARTTETLVKTVADTNWEMRGQGDMNGDGKADLLWRNTIDGMLYYWPMTGAVPQAETYVATVDPAYDIVGTGDVDGDGKSDLLWRNLVNGEVWVWLMDGATPLSQVYVDTVDLGYVVEGVGDLDGDGKADLVWQGAAGDVWVWLMDGTTRVSQTWVATVPDTGYQIQGVADFTGDGQADLLWWHATLGEVWIWTMDGPVRLAETWVTTVPETEYRIVGMGDYTGDGKADLLWHHATRGEVWVWPMAGTTRLAQHYVGTVPDTGYQIVTEGERRGAPPVVGKVVASPSLILTASPTTITVTASITDRRVLSTSVRLQQVDAAGGTLADLGLLRDDGTQGDVTPGDGVYSGQLTLTPAAAGHVYLRASADFRDWPPRVLSEVMAIGVAEPGPAVQAAGPDGGVFGFPNGVILDIPPGALTEPVTLSITALDCAAVDPILSGTYASRLRRCLGGFSAEPRGLVFATPIKASVPVLPLTSGELPLAGVADLTAQAYATLPATTLYLSEQGVMEFDLQRFSNGFMTGSAGVSRALEADEEPGPSRVVATAAESAEAARKTLLDATCMTCSGFQNPACGEFYPVTPETPACCRMPLVTRQFCLPNQPCECCQEKLVRVRSAQSDNFNETCQMLNIETEVTFLDCPNKAPRVERPLTEASGCPTDMTYQVTINVPNNPMYICATQTLTATMAGKSPTTTLARAPVKPIWEGGQAGVLAIDQATGDVTAGQTPGVVPIAAVVMRSNPEAIGYTGIFVEQYPAMAIYPPSPIVQVGQTIPLKAYVEHLCSIECYGVKWTPVDTGGGGSVSWDATGRLKGESAGSLAVRAEYEWCGQHFTAETTIRVDPSPLVLTSIDPPSGLDCATLAFTLRGAGFTAGALVRFDGPIGTPTPGGVSATDVHVVDSETITGRAEGLKAGRYDVVVGLSDGRSITLPSALEVEPCPPPELRLQVSLASCEVGVKYCEVPTFDTPVPVIVRALLKQPNGAIVPRSGVEIQVLATETGGYIDPFRGLTDADGYFRTTIAELPRRPWFRVWAEGIDVPTGTRAGAMAFGITRDVCGLDPGDLEPRNYARIVPVPGRPLAPSTIEVDYKRYHGTGMAGPVASDCSSSSAMENNFISGAMAQSRDYLWILPDDPVMLWAGELIDVRMATSCDGGGTASASGEGHGHGEIQFVVNGTQTELHSRWTYPDASYPNIDIHRCATLPPHVVKAGEGFYLRMDYNQAAGAYSRAYCTDIHCTGCLTASASASGWMTHTLDGITDVIRWSTGEKLTNYLIFSCSGTSYYPSSQPAAVK